MSPPGQSLPRATLIAARSGLLSAPVVIHLSVSGDVDRPINRAAESSLACALAELALAATRAVGHQRRRLSKLRIIGPVRTASRDRLEQSHTRTTPRPRLATKSERGPDLELRADARDHLVGELARAEAAAEVGGAAALRHRLEARLADRAAGLLALIARV